MRQKVYTTAASNSYFSRSLQNLRLLNVSNSTLMDSNKFCVVVALAKLRTLDRKQSPPKKSCIFSLHHSDNHPSPSLQ